MLKGVFKWFRHRERVHLFRCERCHSVIAASNQHLPQSHQQKCIACGMDTFHAPLYFDPATQAFWVLS